MRLPAALLLALSLAFALPSFTGSLAAQTPAKPPYTLTPDTPLTLDLQPREYVQVDVAFAGGKFNEIRIESPGILSRGAFLKAVAAESAPTPAISSSGSDPYISDSGEPFIDIPAMPVEDGKERFQVTALSNSKTDLRTVTATLSLTVQDATPHAVLLTQALTAFARAERVRRERGKAEAAIPAYDQALQAARDLNDRVLEQRVLLSKARFLGLDGSHYAESVQFANLAAAIDTAEAAPGVSALAWKTLGGAYLAMDRYAESIDASKRAANLFRQNGTTFWLGIVLENLGGAYLASGDFDAALTTDTEALRIARELKDDYGIIEMLSEIGSMHKERAEYQEALNDFSAAVELSLPSTFNPMQGEAWANLGELYAVLGETDQALPAYQHALAISQSTRNGRGELETLDHIAELQLEGGQRDAARQSFTNALERARELKLARPQSGLLIGLARAEIQARDFTSAANHLKEAVELAEQIRQPYEQADALEGQGELARAQGRLRDAGSALDQANVLWRGLPDNGRLAQGLTQLAQIEIQQGSFDPANEKLAEAMDLIERTRGSIARGPLRMRYFAIQHHTYDLAVYDAMQLHRTHPGAGYAAKAWDIAERARARSLLDNLSPQRESTVDPANQPLRERLAALGRQIEQTQDHIAQLGTSVADLANAASLQEALHQDLNEEQELESRLSSAASEDDGFRAALTPAAFAQRVLGPGAALLEYWEGERASYAWLIDEDGGLRAATLPPAFTLTEQVAKYRAGLLARNTALPGEDFAQRARRLASADEHLSQRAKLLSATLLPPAIQRSLTSDRTLLLVPDGSLLSLPFAALVEPGGKQYLVQRFHLIDEPSAATAAAVVSLTGRDPAEGERVAVFADPVYSGSDSRLSRDEPAAAELVRGDATLDLSHLSRLPGSRQEAMAIASVAGPQRVSLHLGFEATPSAVKAMDWKSFNVAHFAAHAIASVSQPETSGIVLSMVDSSGRSVDGMLWLRDIRRLHLASDLVVLSGCGTALGENIPGEGLNSLSRAFLESGARDVTATLWSADDAMSSRLMQSFYQGLVVKHLTAPAALRTAQLQMLDDPRHHSPYYWAGFVMEGVWQTR